MKLVHHYVTQLQRSQRPNALAVQVAGLLHQLQLIHLQKIHGQRHHRQHQQVADGEHPQPMNHRFKD
jgi:hypothetical protein